LPEFGSSNFNNLIRKIIKKSLFTERQIEIILNQKKISQTEFRITKGAYYRQVSQSRHKLMALFYSISLLQGLGILSHNDIDVMLKLSENIAVIKDGDVFPEKEEEVMDVIYRLVRQSCEL